MQEISRTELRGEREPVFNPPVDEMEENFNRTVVRDILDELPKFRSALRKNEHYVRILDSVMQYQSYLDLKQRTTGRLEVFEQPSTAPAERRSTPPAPRGRGEGDSNAAPLTTLRSQTYRRLHFADEDSNDLENQENAGEFRHSTPIEQRDWGLIRERPLATRRQQPLTDPNGRGGEYKRPRKRPKSLELEPRKGERIVTKRGRGSC